MTVVKTLPALEYVRQFSADAAVAFQSLRKAVVGAGPLDLHTCELIVLGGLVSRGSEVSFKVHARRLLQDGVDIAALRQAVLVTLAASTTFSQMVDGLRWLDDVLAESGGR